MLSSGTIVDIVCLHCLKPVVLCNEIPIDKEYVSVGTTVTNVS